MRQAMTLYRYLTGPDDAIFSTRVTEALRGGWILYGPPALTFDTKIGRVVCGQAVTKDIDANAYDPSRDLASY